METLCIIAAISFFLLKKKGYIIIIPVLNTLKNKGFKMR